MNNNSRLFPIRIVNLGIWGTIIMLLTNAISIFNLFSILEMVSTIVYIGGFLMLAIAYFKLSKEWEDKSLRTWSLIYVVAQLLVFLSIYLAIVFIMSAFQGAYSATVYSEDQSSLSEFFSELGILDFFVAFALVWGALAFLGFTIYRINKHISEKSRIDDFRTAGIILLIGYLTYLFVIGSLLVFVGNIFQIVAWAKAKDNITNKVTYLSGQ
ncbi:MAG: DUF996 domain-containing protein [Chlorobi bacterium]|nr:DUF996 domain-containing protein [Chlorobiota bacterium]